MKGGDRMEQLQKQHQKTLQTANKHATMREAALYFKLFKQEFSEQLAKKEIKITVSSLPTETNLTK